MSDDRTTDEAEALARIGKAFKQVEANEAAGMSRDAKLPPRYAEPESDGEMLQRLGTDAQKWATAAREFCARFSTPLAGLSEDLMIGWFANAIMAGHDQGASAERRAVDENLAEQFRLGHADGTTAGYNHGFRDGYRAAMAGKSEAAGGSTTESGVIFDTTIAEPTPPFVGLCPDSTHVHEFYMPLRADEVDGHMPKCPMDCPLDLVVYKRLDVPALLMPLPVVDEVEAAYEALSYSAPEVFDLVKQIPNKVTLALTIGAIGRLSAELAARADAWNGNAPSWFPQPPEWLELWENALRAASRDEAQRTSA